MLSTQSEKTVYDTLIIGAGMAGLAAAQRLQQDGLNVLVVDKGRGYGGRMATRRDESGSRWDHGAQYFTVTSPVFADFIAPLQAEGAVTPWFTELKNLSGDVLNSGKTRYASPLGMSGLAKRMAQGLKVVTGQRITRLELTCDAWTAWSEQGEHWQAKSLLITSPLPQTLALFQQSELELKPAQQSLLEAVAYEPCWAVMLKLSEPWPLGAPQGFKGLNSDDIIGWVADNQAKGLDTPVGSITLQASPQFSQLHVNSTPEEIHLKLLAALEEHTGQLNVTNWQAHRWLYAFPKSPLLSSYLRLEGFPYAYLAGDAFGGEAQTGARVEGAVLSGLAAAESLLTQLNSSVKTVEPSCGSH
jgi:renalase